MSSRGRDRRAARQVGLQRPAHREGRAAAAEHRIRERAGAGQWLGRGTGRDDHRADADKLNDQGKDKFRTADLNGALGLFQQANSLDPDPRYVLNICLAYEALEKWGDAMASCKQARAMNPPPSSRRRSITGSICSRTSSSAHDR